MNMLEKITFNHQAFSKAEKKVAQIVLADPKSATRASIAALAQLAQVSEPTVNRFCHRLNTKGFPDFKLQLAQSLASGTPYVNGHVEESDGAEDYTQKIFNSNMQALDVACKSVDYHEINRAVDMLIQAQRISFFGLGASSIVAHDAHYKFFRFNVPVVYYDDILMQRMSCMNCTGSDVVVLISHTGRTKNQIDIAKIAANNGASVIGITAADSPLAEQCHLVLSVDIPEDTDLFMPMASRIVQLTLVDTLATGFTLRRGRQFRDNLRRVKVSLKGTRLDKTELEP